MNESSIYGKFSFVNIPIIKNANNQYFNSDLHSLGITAINLSYLGIKVQVSGNGLGFSRKEAYLSALGEFCERYSASYEEPNLIFDSYDNLIQQYKCYDINQLNYFNHKQYSNTDFKLQKINTSRKIHWKWCYDYFNNQKILFPYFMIGLTNNVLDGKYHINTSTGLSSHNSIENALLGGFLECVERDAFCKFWYLQKQQQNNKLSSEYILSKYPNNKRIQSLYSNKKIKIITFNLCEYSYTPTFVTFIFFKEKGKLFQSVGSSSRLHIEDALIKSCIEAYQGIEYAKICYREHEEILKNIEDFSVVNNFEKHFAFYNVNPNLGIKSPIIKDALDWKSNFTNKINDEYAHHIIKINPEEIQKKGIKQMYYSELTTPDVEQLGIKVVKVITPQLHLLTGNFNYPYLGLFAEHLDLFTEYPHPFP
jgi:ribosomal protein S12 methylthiotransferase accessory factor